MSIREDRINELINELYNLQNDFIEEQVAIIEDYITKGQSNNGDGVLSMLEKYLTEVYISIGSSTYNSRMNFGIDSTIVTIDKILKEIKGTDENPPIAKRFVAKARQTIAEKVETQMKQAIAVIKDTSARNINIEEENKSIKNITEEQRANRTSKLKTENINNGCKKIEDSIKTIKIDRRPFDNAVINSKAISETTGIVKRYLYNISKDAMHYMYRGNMISGRVESFNYQLTDLNAIAQLTTMINRKDEELLKIIDNKYRQVEAEIEYMQSKPNTSYANQGIIGKLLFNDESSLVEIKL